jgi:formamidopyrimidine-DNA glycosylase
MAHLKMTGMLRNDADTLKESEEGQKERVKFHTSDAPTIVFVN